MFFLLRMAFWLGLVLVLLPTGSAHRAPAGSEVGASAAISAASATVGDLKGFCGRQPDACTIGSQIATALSYRAQAGAKMLYDFLTEKMASKPVVQQASQNTLTPADLIPPWRGPAPRKDAKHSV